MRHIPLPPQRHRDSFAALLVLAAAAVYFYAYLLAADAPFMFDDVGNLEGLAQVQAGAPAVDFIAGQTASVLGRPLSMASFLFNLEDWPNNPAGFRIVNTLIHFANSGALALLIYLITSQIALKETNRIYIALSSGCIWLLHPFVASTVLSVVQRMALLSGTFTIMGLIGYTIGRAWTATSPRAGIAMMSASLIAATLLSTLAKENGALLPIFAGILELTAFSRHPILTNSVAWKLWKLLFFVCPLLALAGYFIISWDGHLATYAIRDFSPRERIATESIILFNYLAQIFFPRVLTMGLFHDDIRAVSFADPTVILASTTVVLLIAYSIWARKLTPIFSLAILLFFSSHLLESTILPLELYFEHRNYLATGFFSFFLCTVIWKARGHIAPIVTCGLLLTLTLLTISITHLWGNPLIAAKWWHDAHPTSPRAAQFAANEYIQAGHPDEARRFLSETSARVPNSADLAIQTATMECSSGSPILNKDTFDKILSRIPNATFSFAIFDALSKYEKLISDGNCPGVDKSDPEILWRTALTNTKIQAHHMAKSFVYNSLSRLAAAEEDREKATVLQLSAYEAWRTPENASMVTIRLLEEDKTSEAHAFLVKSIENDAPKISFLRARWLRRLVIQPKDQV